MKRTKKPIGMHWCGGYLFRDGHRAVRCNKCDRVKFVDSCQLRKLTREALR